MMLLYLAILSLFFPKFHVVVAKTHSLNRSHLNETYYGKTRWSVDGFIDNHRMNLLERLLKKNKHKFLESPSLKCFIFEGHNHTLLFESVIAEEDIQEAILYNCDMVIDGRSCFNRAISILKKYPERYNNSVGRELREELEAYIYIRDKIYDYASQVFNTTATSCMGGDGAVFFYYLPNSPVMMTINGRDYMRPPHIDYCKQTQGYWDRPFRYTKPLNFPNLERLYSATLYFTDVPESSGGWFEWFDFPNNHKLPPEKGREIRDPTKIHRNPRYIYADDHKFVYSPSFDDPDLNITRIHPRKGKLLLFSSPDDHHAVHPYTGHKERWAVMFGLSNKDIIENGVPQYIIDKEGPILTLV